jgi:hypothetical protein
MGRSKMSDRGSHAIFLRATLAIFFVTAAMSAGFAAWRRGPVPPPEPRPEARASDAALDHLRAYLLRAKDLRVVVEGGKPAIAWNNGFSLEKHGILDYLRSHLFTFTATPAGGGAPDVFRARARVNPEGLPIEVTDLVNLTRTEHGEELALAVNGPFVAFANRIDGLLRQVVILDYRGEIPSTVAGYGLGDRLMNAVANWQEVNDYRGVGRRTYEFSTPPGRVGLRFEGTPPRLVVETGEGRSSRIDPETGAMQGEGAGLTAIPPTPKAARMFVDWVANTIRRVIGEQRFEWLKVYALAVKDKWQRVRNALFGPGAPDSDEVDEARVVTAHARVKQLKIQFGQDPNWPPPPVPPILKEPKLRGEGEWVDIYDFDLRNPGAPPPMLKTVIRPDPKRPHAAVRIVLFDPRQTDLHIVAGTKHPESTTGQLGDGLIPRDKETMSRLLAAFNGGFKTMHGAFGMMVKGKVIVPAKKGAATIARLRDGRTAIGTWDLANGAHLPSAVAYRQNLPPLIAGGVINPTELKRWGNTVDDMDGTHTYRSAVGVTQHGHLMYAWGDDLSADTMAQAMARARCDYAIHLDMNFGHSRFEFYRVYDDESITRRHPDRKLYVDTGLRYQAKKLSTAQISWLYPRYLKRDIRDFFYVTLRRVFPFEDPEAPSWTVEGLPEEFQEFPPLAVRTAMRSGGAGEDEIQVFKFDATRARLELRAGTEAAGTHAPLREIASADVPQLAAVIGAGAAEEGLRPPGTWIQGQAVAAPTPGAMTLFVSQEGRLSIERWTKKAEGRWSLRQGLGLIEAGRLCDEAKAVAHSRPRLRGAIGLDRRGDILYAVAKRPSPLPLAETLLKAGAKSAVALGPGAAGAFFHLYTPGPREGEVVAHDLARRERHTLSAIPLSHNQAFLYLLPKSPAPRIVPLAQVQGTAERTARR